MFISSSVLLLLVTCKFASTILVGSSQDSVNTTRTTEPTGHADNNFNPNVTFHYEADTYLINHYKKPQDDKKEKTHFETAKGSSEAINPLRTSARNGRMLDLDALMGDFSASQARKERIQTGRRQSRYLQQDQGHSLDVGGKRLHIQGFIPIVGVKDVTEHEQAESTKVDSSSSNHQQSQQVGELPYAQSSIGHASFPTSIQRYLNSADPPNQQVEAKFSGASVVDSLRRPIKKLANFAYGEPAHSLNVPQPSPSQNCLCVPFYMCKNGYVSESSLGKSQIQQMISQQQSQLHLQQQQQQLINQGLELKSGQLLPQQPASEGIASSVGELKEHQYSNSYVPVDERSFNHEPTTMPPSENFNLDNQFLNQSNEMSGKLFEVLTNEDETSGMSSYATNSSVDSGGSDSSQDILGRMLGLKSNSKLMSQSQAVGICGLLRTCCNIPMHLYPSQQDMANERLMAQLGVTSALQRFQQLTPNSQQVIIPSGYQRFFQAQASSQQVQKQLPFGLPSTQIMHQPLNIFSPETTAMAHRSNQFQLPSNQRYLPQQQQQFQLTRAAPTQLQTFQSSLVQPVYQQQQAKTIATYPLRSSATNSQQLFQVLPQHQPFRAQQLSVGTRKLLEGRCGLRQALGVTGRVQSLQYHESSAEFGEYPAQTAILKRLSGADSLFVCGGTLISQYWVATAAHCIKKHPISELKIRLGEWDVHRDDEFYPFVEKEVRDLVVHPEFVSGNLVNDIALLRLDSPVDPSLPHVNPACLPSVDESFTKQRCWVTGWGKDSFGQKGSFQSVLREVELPVVNSGECESALRQTRLGLHYRLHAGFICAGGEGGRDACEGDGGSGLYCVQSDGLIKVAGLVSWGIGCGQAGLPGVYVNLAHYRPWIENIISIDEDIYSPYQNMISSSLISERSNANNFTLTTDNQRDQALSGSNNSNSNNVMNSNSYNNQTANQQQSETTTMATT